MMLTIPQAYGYRYIYCADHALDGPLVLYAAAQFPADMMDDGFWD